MLIRENIKNQTKQRIFCYVRVIEIPAPRGTAYDAKRFGVNVWSAFELAAGELIAGFNRVRKTIEESE